MINVAVLGGDHASWCLAGAIAELDRPPKQLGHEPALVDPGQRLELRRGPGPWRGLGLGQGRGLGLGQLWGLGQWR